jgi:hypothetical protein
MKWISNRGARFAAMVLFGGLSMTVGAGAHAVPSSSRRIAAVAPVSGAWLGKLSRYHSSKLTFTVSANHKTIHRFQTSVVPIVCGGGFSGPVIENVSIGVSSATIKKDGTFHGKLVVSSSGTKSEETLDGKFTSKTAANGHVTYKAGGCNVTEKFTAHKK